MRLLQSILKYVNANHFNFFFEPFVFFLFSSCLIYAETPSMVVPRTLLALYDSNYQANTYYLRLHQLAEMPLNHLGLQFRYHDINQGLPEITEDPNILGAISWFPGSFSIKHPEAYMRWAIKIMDAGKRLVVLDNPGFNLFTDDVSKDLADAFWSRLGAVDKDKGVSETYNMEVVYADPLLFPFERDFKEEKPPFNVLGLFNEQSESYLSIQIKNEADTLSHVIINGPKGAYVASSYVVYKPLGSVGIAEIRRWYVNPFELFRRLFHTDAVPKPDTTTLAGRRIYYSQIDGDGWNNLTQLEEYQKRKSLSSTVIYEQILVPYNLPVTVAPIAADIDLKWVGTKEAIEVAKEIFQLPHVEVGCHTFTHPFDWNFFYDYTPEKEIPFFPYYPNGGWIRTSFFETLKHAFFSKSKLDELGDELSINDEQALVKTKSTLAPGYVIPRAYALQPYNLHLEVFGAIDVINALTPHKRVKVYQWSGNCQPSAETILFTREAKVRNINGGDTRFDFDTGSYAWVSPIGRSVGDQFQVYCSASNENIYTDLWTKKFYAFNQVITTFKRTDVPIRVKPINVYYHIYSGERLASLNAVKQCLDYALSQNIIPIATSHFAAMCDGFRTTQIIKRGDQSWQINKRGDLQTIRFDRATLQTVDFDHSEGVIGQRHLQGSLYVYLDQSHSNPVITLIDSSSYAQEPPSSKPYLIDSRWQVWNLNRPSANRFTMTVQGFGNGEMRWRVPEDGLYLISINDNQQAVRQWTARSESGILEIRLPVSAIEPIDLTVDRQHED